MRATRFDEDGMLRLSARPISASTIMKENAALRHPSGLLDSAFLTVGNELVPYDPDLPYLFFGEEICMTLRMWTSGFDFFAPLENVAYHLWSRNYRPALDISSSEARAARLRSQSKVMDIITSGATSSTPLGQMALGWVRAVSRIL